MELIREGHHVCKKYKLCLLIWFKMCIVVKASYQLMSYSTANSIPSVLFVQPLLKYLFLFKNLRY